MDKTIIINLKNLLIQEANFNWKTNNNFIYTYPNRINLMIVSLRTAINCIDVNIIKFTAH